jgi:hypothetical protein
VSRDRPLWTSLLAVAVAVAGVVTRPHPVEVLDPFTSTAAQVAAAHRLGHDARCALRPAVWESQRPDAGRFDPSLLLGPAPGGGRLLDVARWPQFATIVDDRLGLCVAKGFDGVEADAVGLPEPYRSVFAALAARHGLTVNLRGSPAVGVGSAGT